MRQMLSSTALALYTSASRQTRGLRGPGKILKQCSHVGVFYNHCKPIVKYLYTLRATTPCLVVFVLLTVNADHGVT